MKSKEQRLMDFWSGSVEIVLLINIEFVIAFGGKIWEAVKTWVILESGNAHTGLLALKQKMVYLSV